MNTVEQNSARWTAARRMIDCAQRSLKPKADRIRAILQDSDLKLHPLKDPLTTDFGGHRWLSGSREESYSDWLAWIFERLPAQSVFRILGLATDAPQAKAVVQREKWIRLQNREGKLDIFLSIGATLVLVEVKVVPPESAELDKNDFYMEWLTQCHTGSRQACLIILKGSNIEADGFSVRYWNDISVELRREAVSILRDRDVVFAAMVLAFVAAIEQNLLKISPVFVSRVSAGKCVPQASDQFQYLETLHE